MVGGTVLEVCDHPTDRHKIYVNVGERPYKRIEECAIYVERNANSEKIELGDALWWQGNFAMWTPQTNRVADSEAERRKLKCGVDYDIQIPRIGFSGVNHPFTSSEAK